LALVLVWLSPKFQLYEVALLELLEKVAVAPLTLAPKPAVGLGLTVTMLVWVLVLLPAALPTVKVTEYVPGREYTTRGFCALEVEGVPPGNCHSKVALLAEELLLNWTLSGPQPVALLALNPAVGGVTMTTVWVEVLEPQAFVAVKVTV
jgi:hypothetical protein